jgi:TfoX/Sxy family transcriptional regulator of competence genes
MAYDEDLAERIRGLITAPTVEQKMFGGLAFLVNGHMSVTVSRQGGLMLRCAPEQTEALLREDGAEEMVMRGRAMDGWVRVRADAAAADAVLQVWVDRGVSYALSLPPKG